MGKLARDKEDVYVSAAVLIEIEPQWFRGLGLGRISEAAEVGGISRLSLPLVSATCPDKLTCTPIMC